MYSKAEASYIKEQFWTRFGKYMSPILSAEGEKINWINYKTGIKQLNFKMNATHEWAYIGIEIGHKDPQQASQLYGQFQQLRGALEQTLGETWQWQSRHENEHHQLLSSISCVHQPCNIFKEEDWPVIISFLKPRILTLDQFWCNHKLVFEMMQ